MGETVSVPGGLNIIQQSPQPQMPQPTATKTIQSGGRKYVTATKKMQELQANESVVISANDPNLSNVLKSLGVAQSQPVYIQTMSPSSLKIVKAETTKQVTAGASTISLPITLPMNTALPFGNATTITLPMSTTITQKRIVQQQPQQQQQHHQQQQQQAVQLHTLTNVPQSRGRLASNVRSQTIKYADMDDIELPDGTKIGYATVEPVDEDTDIQDVDENDPLDGIKTEAGETLAQKYSIIAASAVKNFDGPVAVAVTDAVSASQSQSAAGGSGAEEGSESYACRHCGKRYRWKSTLRRHENDECGGKEPAHQCPYCSYKAKQRGNLGVHVRKHHTDQPQLESRRKKRSLDGTGDSMLVEVTHEDMLI